jgi:hypothetical protein
MNEHREHIVFAAIIALVIGGIGWQTMRSEATASQVEKISPIAMMQDAHDLPTQTPAAP